MDISKMKAEIDDMEKVLSDNSFESEQEDFEDSNAEPESEPSEEEQEPESEEEEEEEEPTDEEPPAKPEPAEPTEPEEGTLEWYKREAESLRNKINELSQPKTPAPQEPTEATPSKPEESDLGEQDFITEEEFDAAVSDPKEFNKLLNKVYQKAVTETRERVSEGILRSIPEVVRSNIYTVTNLKAASEKFYEDNKDLAPFKKVVAAVFEEVASENPDKEFHEILGSVADEARKRLDLHKKATTPKNNEPAPPKLPRRRGRQPKNLQPDTKGIESELDAMERVLNS